PYRGETPALTDLISGQAQVLIATTGSALSFVKAGSVRGLAVTTPTRLPQLPDVPPIAQYLPGYAVSSWSGLCAPKGTPVEIVDLLNKEINTALADPTIKQRIAEWGGTGPGGSAAGFAKFLRSDVQRWVQVAAFAHVKMN
ncbi:MAG: tripartite tricarboxylate transporter substrate-binding protein, partial [Pseudomonadota bacterium]